MAVNIPSEFITVLIFENDRRSARNNVVLVFLSVLAVFDNNNDRGLLLRLERFVPVSRVIARGLAAPIQSAGK